MSRREHLLQVQKVLKRTPEELIGPAFPTRYGHIWDMFINLHSGRSYNSGGPNPLSWSDIKAWNDLLHVGLKEWEVRAIKALDGLWLRAVSEDAEDG